MKRSRVRVSLSILVILIAAAVVGIELKERLEQESPEAGIRRLDSFWTSRRRAGASELGQFTGNAERVVPALLKSLSDSDTEVRLGAIKSLERFGEKSKPAGPALREMLRRDPDAKIRRCAASLLGTIRDKDAVPDLTQALDDADTGVRVEATWSLGAWGTAVASAPIIDKLLSALSLDHPEALREASVETLDLLARDQERVARLARRRRGTRPERRGSQAGRRRDQRTGVRIPGSRPDRGARRCQPTSPDVGRDQPGLDRPLRRQNCPRPLQVGPEG